MMAIKLLTDKIENPNNSPVISKLFGLFFLARLKEQRQLLSYKYTLFVFVYFLLFDMLQWCAARFRPIGRNLRIPLQCKLVALQGICASEGAQKREHLDGAPSWRACFKEQRQLLLYGYILFVFVYFLLFDMLQRFAARFRPIGRN